MLLCPLCSNSARPLAIAALPQKHYGHCSQCDLRFLYPQDRLALADEKAHYELHNNDVNDPRYQNFVRPICEIVRRMFRPEALGLDYGAGPGPVLVNMLRDCGYAMNLYDPLYWPEASALQNSYDFIVATEVVEHFYEPLAEFQRLRSLLKDGGALILMTLLVTDDTDFVSWYYRKDPTHVVFYSERTLHWIQDKLGFTAMETDGKRLVVFQNAGSQPPSRPAGAG